MIIVCNFDNSFLLVSVVVISTAISVDVSVIVGIVARPTSTSRATLDSAAVLRGSEKGFIILEKVTASSYVVSF